MLLSLILLQFSEIAGDENRKYKKQRTGVEPFKGLINTVSKERVLFTWPKMCLVFLAFSLYFRIQWGLVHRLS